MATVITEVLTSPAGEFSGVRVFPLPNTSPIAQLFEASAAITTITVTFDNGSVETFTKNVEV